MLDFLPASEGRPRGLLVSPSKSSADPLAPSLLGVELEPLDGRGYVHSLLLDKHALQLVLTPSFSHLILLFRHRLQAILERILVCFFTSTGASFVCGIA